jgi:D-glycero-D-manno-heptose 1,7-bisphosphate phosphatase
MLVAAARDCNIDLAESVMVGDRSSDVEAGRAAGCKTVFIDLGYVSELKPASPDFTVRSLAEAADVILGMMPN